MITRKDLTPAQQMVQTNHALSEFFLNYTELAKDWASNLKNLVILSVDNEQELQILLQQARKIGIEHSYFDDADLDVGITAIALNGSEKTQRLTSNIPLAFKDSKKKDRIIFHYNKAHNNDKTIPPWVVKHKGTTYYIEHIESERGFKSKETPDNPHTKGSIVFRGELEVKEQVAYVT